MLMSGKTPLVDTSQAEGFNMSVLKRMDEDILEILYSATHVAVYEFDTIRRSWRRSDIEGTLFLVKRCSAPRFRMIVVNSKRIDNFMEEVDGSLECEVLQTFLLYTKGNNQLYGIWFYDEKNCEEFGNYLKRIIKGMPKASPSGTPKMKTSTDQRGTDLRHELQSIFNQLNTSQGSNQKSTGESDHLMRLFKAAKERSPSTPTQGAQSSAEALNESIPSTEATAIPSTESQSMVLPSVPSVPLPPDFFKPTHLTVAVAPVEEPSLQAPDPLNLPLPAAESVQNGKEVHFENGESDATSSLTRFFGRSDQEGINDAVRDRFRQALMNLLSNDEMLDILISEFKKVGIPIQ